MIPRRTFITQAALVSATGLFAQEQKHSHAASNGGQIIEIGKIEAELVARIGEVSLNLTDDHDKNFKATGYSATATVLAKGNQQKTIELVLASDNRLAAKYDFAIDGRFRATVVLKHEGKEVDKGRYNLDIKK
ncbi:hypothetical protein PY365_20255 [Roseiarcaceae bacterium H3SJ34-1]|uniref:hypothetical protein n=1 Tax=Terripilifer ovatus TaxID=3032367 RepID=UPI003AB9BA86|nr:hypothetical protein [Roseiarcaceae bacterium H3SJ34-1]